MLVSGRTGVGKSTLLGVLTGLVPRFTGGTLTGDVLLDGRQHPAPAAARARARRRLRRAGPARRLRHRHGRGGARLRHGAARPAAATRCAAGSRRPSTCSGIADLRDRDLRTLSGGQQQRVAIGSVLTMHPRRAGARRADLRARPDRGRGRAGHADPAGPRPRPHRAARRAPAGAGGAVRRPDGACSPATGGCVVGSPADVLAASPVVPPIVELGRAAGWSPLPLSVRDAPPAGRRAHARLAAAGRRRRAVAVDGCSTARGLTVAHGRTVVPSTASTSTCAAGGVTALMGRNGSGKSSLLWALQGTRTRAARARCRVGGEDPGRARRRRRARAGRAGAADRRRPALPRDRRRGVRRRRCRAGAPGTCRDAARPAGARASTATGTRATCPRASGWRWCWRSCSPPGRASLLLDEPTRGLDYAAKAGARRGSSPTSPPTGHGVLVATHDVEFVAQRRRRGGRAGRRARSSRPVRRARSLARVAGVRAAGHQDPRRAVAAGRRGRRRRWRRRHG